MRSVRSWGWRLLQAASVAVAALFVQVFFFHIVTDFQLWGITIRGPGDLAVPLLLAVGVFALSLKPWKWSDRRAKGALLFLFVILFCVLFHPHAGSDAAQYYAAVRTLWLDRDLNFYDDALRNLGLDYLCTLHERGYTYNGFPIGPAFFWSPFFLLAHGWCLLGNAFAVRYAAEGYDRVYLLMVCASSSLYGLAGAAIGYRLLRQWVSAGAASLATALVVFASPLLLYLFVEGAYSHALGFLLGTAVVALWWKRYRATPEGVTAPPVDWSAAFGLVCGLATLVRWQGGLLLIFPLLDFVEHLVRLVRRRAESRGALWRLLKSNMVFAFFFLLAFLPQMVVWRVQTGQWLLVPQGGEYLANWWEPKVGKVLFSRLHGLFSWHPVLLVATLCLPQLWRRHRPLLVRAAFVLLGQVYINSVVHDWWAGGSFGQRRFCVVLVLFAVPLALGLERLFRWASSGAQRRRAVRGLAVVVVVLLVWSNFLLLAQYVHGPVGSMGKLRLDDYLARWVVKKPNVLETVRNNFLYNPYLNGIGYGLLRLDFRLLCAPLAQLAVIGFIGWIILWPSWFLALPGVRWIRQRWFTAGLAAVLCFLGLVSLAGWDARLLWVLNLRPDVPFGNVRPLSVARTHRYVGGFVNRRLGPGEALSAQLARRFTSHSVIVTSYVTGAGSLASDDPVARLTLHGAEGRTFTTTLRAGQHTDASNAMAYRPATPSGGTMPLVARRWRPGGHALHNECSWYAEWPLPQEMTVREVRLESVLPKGELQVEGIAFRPLGPERFNPVALMARRSRPLDFHAQCNVAYDHNVFAPGDSKDYSHFKFSGLSLYNGPIELRLYPPYEETHQWNALTTCYQKGAVFRVPVQPPCRVETLHVAYAAGLIRTHRKEPLADIVLVYESGEEEVCPLFTNAPAFDYLEGYRPGGTVLAGGSSSYMYDGRLSHWVIEAQQSDEPVVEVKIVDANGSEPAGISVLALTAVSPPVEELSPDVRFAAVACDKRHGRLLVADRLGRLQWVALPSGVRTSVAASPGALSAVAVPPDGDGYYALFEDGRVDAEGGAVHWGNAEVSRTQSAVDIEVDPSGKGYHVLLSDGEVVSFGETAFPPWHRRPPGVYAAFTVDACGETWFGLTRGGGIVWAGREPEFDLWERPNWGWDVARDIQATPQGLIVLDGFGGLHPFGEETYRTFEGYIQVDMYVALEILPSGDWVVLDRAGKVHIVPKPDDVG